MMLGIKFGLMRSAEHKDGFDGEKLHSSILGKRFFDIINSFLKTDLFSHISAAFVYQFVPNWVIACLDLDMQEEIRAWIITEIN